MLIIQNNIGNTYSPTTIILAITSQINKAKLSTHVELSTQASSLRRDSVILAEQMRMIDKSRLKQKVAQLNSPIIGQIENAVAVSIGLET